MPNYTTNYNLKKPLQEEFYNIDDHNGNMDIIDEKLKELFEKEPEGNFIPTSQKGAANGVATLDNTGKIPSNQIPSTGNFIPTSQKGVAGGVASLGDDGLVPAEQLPEISSTKYQSATLYTYGWTEGSDGRFYQTVNVADVTPDTKVVVVDVDLDTDDVDAKIAYLEAWGHPSANEVDQGNGTLTFYAWEQPVSNIPINVGVM